MALAGEFFLIGWEGFTVGDLYDLNKETMPSSARGSLSTEDAEATLAYMLQANGYPAGDVPFTRSDRTLAEALIKLP